MTIISIVQPIQVAVISRAQGKAALVLSGHWQTVLDFIASIPNATQKALTEIALHDTQEWRRDSEFISTVAAGIGLTEEQIDTLFASASDLTF